MDKYLEAIEQDSQIKSDLVDKKTKLEESKKSKGKEKKVLEEKNKDYNGAIEEAHVIDDYYKNTKEYKKKFRKRAIRFAIGCMIAYIICGGSLVLLMMNVDPLYGLNIKALIGGNFAIGSLMGAVEYMHVSRDFRELTKKRSEGENKSFILEADNMVDENKTLINELELEIEDLSIDIDDLETVIDELDNRIFDYRSRRNNLVESLVENLDNHIEGFEYEEFTPNKVKDKKRTD
jgi:Branched-chain amino acid ABC-type transport system, permease components